MLYDKLKQVNKFQEEVKEKINNLAKSNEKLEKLLTEHT